ncbi:MAG: adenylosuccinate lyase [Gammaproteobacteria bacterium]|nr:adenylosuccinate lyase [Gammaproteobacteria bacterium]
MALLDEISPLDGRYSSKVEEMSQFCSEGALINKRILIEIKWLIYLIDKVKLKALRTDHKLAVKHLELILNNFDNIEAQHLKNIEQTICHDVKSVEYYIKNKLAGEQDLQHLIPFIHFACTSEDINNLSYAILTKGIRDQIVEPHLEKLINKLRGFAHDYASHPMLSHTHGQIATPSTVGKEFANFVIRLKKAKEAINKVAIMAKFNGAVGNYNAHITAYPNLNWRKLNKQFVESFGIEFSEYSTQIEAHDYLAELSHAMIRANNILIDLCRDIWIYMAFGYFHERLIEQEVGSSTMPHKVNPIQFENAEGNLGVANSLFDHFANKLPISRLQRDLSDSTVLRNLGVAFAHTLLAHKSIEKGLERLEINDKAISIDLSKHWEILAEAIQTVMRSEGIREAYEKLKSFSRGKEINRKLLQQFIEESELSDAAKQKLVKLTPCSYLGLAEELAKEC